MAKRLEQVLSKLGADTERLKPYLEWIYNGDAPSVNIDEQPLFTRDLRYSNNTSLNGALTPCDHIKGGALEAFHIALFGLAYSLRKQNPFIFEDVTIEELTVVCCLCDCVKSGNYYPASNYGKERGIFWEYEPLLVPAPQAELTVAFAATKGVELTNNEYIGLRLAAAPLSEENSKSFGRHVKPWLLAVNGLAQVIRHNEFALETYANTVLEKLAINEPIVLTLP